MNELIKVTQEYAIADETQPTINARELHEFLESKQDFSTWIKNRIAEYDFKENHDFISLHKKMEREIGATRRIEYFISLDMAKELSMVERNEKGKQARQYFIECEKKLQQAFRQPETDPLKQKRLDIMEINAKTRRFAQFNKALDKISHLVSPVSLETLVITTTEDLFNIKIDYRPQIRPTFSATEIGHQLGVSANQVGKLANQHGLKTEQYGMFVLSKSQHSSRQVQTFAYYTEVLPVLRRLMKEPS